MSRLFISLIFGINLCLVVSEIFKTITITENDMSIQVLANLTKVLADKMHYSHEFLKSLQIVPLSENEFSPFKLQSNQLIQPNNGVDREAVCQVKPDENQRKLCEEDLCCKLIGFQYSTVTDLITFFILIKILDQNDKAPQFSSIKRPFVKIPENVETGYTIDLPMATDSDSEKYSVRRYSLSNIYNLDQTNDFRLHVTNEIPPKPQLIVNAKLDYEKVNKYIFRLLAYDFDDKSIGNSYSTTIEIEIDDLNDNVPKFSQLTYNTDVDENKRNDKLIKFAVTDPDSGRNGVVTVSIVDKTDELSKKFKIFEIQRNEFYLELINPLDYETDPHLYEFVLLAADQGTPSLSSTAQVKIHLKNLNDNGPKIKFKKLGFSQSNSISIIEGLPAHSLVVEVRVKDADTNLNMIHCNLVDYKDLFFLESPNKINLLLSYKQFNLKTINKIDRESNHGSFLRITISCTDSEPNRQITTNESLNIQIEDVNDNSPIFSQQTYVGNVDENQVNVIVNFLKPIIVGDRDSGLNGKFEFFLEDFKNLTDSSDFLIDKISGKIFTQRSLDYEIKNQFRFKIIAVDRGYQPLTSSSTININVLDLNDNAPKFQDSHYIFNVFENVTIGWKIGTLQATDDDTDRKNKDIYYSVESKGDRANYIDIDRFTGELRTIKPLDRETLESISIKVRARNPYKYSSHISNTESEVDVMIKVLDVNDNAPKFIPRVNTKPKVEFIVEQFADGNMCAELPYTVQDIDDGGNNGQNCCYTILENDYNKLFSLMTDSPSYICLQRKPEKYQSYTVTLVARDRPPNVEGGLTSKISFPVLIMNDPHSKVSTSGVQNIPDSRFSNQNDSKILIIIGILTTVVLVVIIIIIIIIIIIKRCSIPEQDCENTKCYQGLSMNRNEGTKVNYLVSESGLSPGKATISRGNLTNPQYVESINKTLTRNMQQIPSNVSSPFTSPAFHQIIANQGVRIIPNPNRFPDHYTFEWTPVPDYRDRSMRRNPSSVDKIRSMSPTKSGSSFNASSKMLNEDQLDSGYQILNPFGLSSSPHQQQQFNSYSPENLLPCDNEMSPVDTRSLTLLNNFFDDNNNGPNSKTTPRTMKKNYFQTTFV